MVSRIAHYRRLMQLYRSYRRKDTVVAPLPVRIWVELSAECNLQCVMCPNKDLPTERKGHMDAGLFRRTIDEAAGFAHEVSLHHRGESLLHPEAMELIAYAATSGMRTKLHTNGVLLDAAAAEAIVASDLHRLSFSFDGGTAADYEKVRRGAAFEKVVQNIEGVLRARGRLRQKGPIVAIELIRLSRNQVEKEKVKRFLGRFRGMGLDQVVVKAPHNWAGYLAQKEPLPRASRCTFPWNAAVILYNGELTPCTQDFFASCVVGSVRERSIREIWNGEPMQRLRRAFAEGRIEDFPACIDCDRIRRRTFLGIPAEYLRQLVLGKMP